MTNIAVVVLDTVRYDSFYRAFDWLDGAHFSRAYSTSHWTVPAHATLFTGEYASNVGVHGGSPTLDCPERTLAERFQAEGYRTRALSANAQLNQYEGWDRGFDEFVTTANLGRTDESVYDWAAHIEETEPGLSRHLTGVARCFSPGISTIRSLKYGYDLFQTEPYDGGAKAVRKRLRATEFGDEELLFVNLMDAHTPYRPPPGEHDAVTVVVADALADTVSDPGKIRAAYRESVRHLAGVYRDIYDELHDSFDYVVTLSDHGELLGEHGLWNHSISLHPELIHIPLVVSGPAVDSSEHHDPVNLLDVHQTIATLGDVDVESAGRNLFDTLVPRELLFESHGLLPFHKQQFERYELPAAVFDRWQTPLYGYITPAGAYCYEPEPGGFRTLGTPDVANVQARLDDIVADKLERRPLQSDQPDVSEEVKDRLEDLGYA